MKDLFLPLAFLILRSLLPLELAAQDQNLPKTPLRTHFDPAQYRGGIQNWDFSQDTSGILYVANNDGLLIFDGENWKSIKVPAATKIRTVYADSNGDIYVGGQAQIGLFRPTKFGLQFESLLDKLPHEDRDISETWKIVKHEEKLYFSTLDNLFVLNDGVFSKLDLPEKPYRIHCIEGRLFVQLKQGGIYELISNQLTLLKGSESIKTELMGATRAPTGFYFFGIDGSIYHIDNSKTELINLKSLQGNITNVVLQLSNGNIAMGTQNAGLLILDQNLNLKNHFNNDEGITNRTVIALHEDGFQNLWVGLHTGIDYLELSSPISIVTEQINFEGTGYAATIWQGDTYLGTNVGLFKQNGNTLELIKNSEGQVYNLSPINNGRLILNHHKGAFEVMSNGLLEPIHHSGNWNFKSTPIKDIYMAGSYDGIRFFKYQNGKWIVNAKVEGLNESSRIMEFENDSVIWMTHGYKGAFRVTMDKALEKTWRIDHYDESKGFPSKNLISVYKIQGDLVFTGATGLYSYAHDQDKFIQHKFLNEILGFDHISRMVNTEKSDIYFIQDRKLGRLINESLGSFKKETAIFNRINKYLSDDLESITILNDENMLIGGKEGFIHFDPNADFNRKEPFEVLIREIKVVYQDSVSTISPYLFNRSKLNHGESLIVHYASPYFDGFEELEYAYRIFPLQPNWSEWSPINTRELNFLPAGKYTLELKAKNIYEEESKITSLSFSVLNPWYSTDFAKLLFALSILSGFVLFSKRQNKKYIIEKNAINQSKTEAIKEKEMKISEIQETSMRELAELRNEKFKIEINYKNTQLSSVTTHLLNKNELIQGIKKNIQYTIDNGPTKEELRKVLKSIESNLTDDESWDQFAAHFDQVHANFLTKLKKDYPDMSPQETKLAAYLRMNLTSKNIAQLLNISLRGVEISRYRLRKRMNLERETNLVSFLTNI